MRGGAGTGSTQGAHRRHALLVRGVGSVPINLCELLTTWENWSASDTLARALENATTEEARARITMTLDAMPATEPLAALRDGAELVSILTGWQWQAVYAARRAGASCEQVAGALGADVEQARTNYGDVLDRQETVLGRDVDA